jgi:uncharacterized protein
VSNFIQVVELRMPLPVIESGHCNVDLKPSPIDPEARSHRLAASTDGAAATLIWSCTEGKFNWCYDVDETVLILEGSMVLESDGMPPRRSASVT